MLSVIRMLVVFKTQDCLTVTVISGNIVIISEHLLSSIWHKTYNKYWRQGLVLHIEKVKFMQETINLWQFESHILQTW